MTRSHSTFKTRACVMVLGALFSATALADATTDRAKQLIDTQKGKEAFALLLPLEAQRAGEVEYDLLLGLAALDAGDPQRAIFALERVLAQQPNNGPARAAIGRAFFEVGDKQNAKTEFENAQKTNPPADTRAVIDKYLNALAASTKTSRLNGYLSAGFGRDSNINSATGQTNIFIPLFNLNAIYSGVSQKANYWNVGAGIDGAAAISNSWSLIGGADVSYKDNISKRFDTGNASGRLGLRWNESKHAVTLAGLGSSLNMDDPNGRLKRNTLGGLAQWQYEVNDTTQVGVIGQAVAIRNPGGTIRDTNRATLGLNFGKALGGANEPYIFGSVYFGNERAKDGAFGYLGHKPVGMVLGGQFKPAPTWTVFGTAGYEVRRYNAVDPLWLTTRRDNTTDLRVGASWAFLPTWSLTPALSYTRNASNVVVSAYNKTTASLTVRKDF